MKKEILNIRRANKNDAQLYFDWANDELVRKQSFHPDEINLENHLNWFSNKLKDQNCFLFVFENDDRTPAGQVRIENNNSSAIIGISIDKNFRGKGLGVEMLTLACNQYHLNNQFPIFAYIKLDNPASLKIFEKAGFKQIGKDIQNEFECYKLILES